jgi:Secretion system C-terminal sorting domain
MKKLALLYIISFSLCLSIMAQAPFSQFYELENPNAPGKNWSHALLAHENGFVLLNGGNCNVNTEACGGVHIIDSNGEALERKPFDFFEYPPYPAFDIIATSDEHYLISGLEVLPGINPPDYNKLRMWMMKLKMNGDTLWVKRYDDPTEDDEDANDILETPGKDGYYLQGDVGKDFHYSYKTLIRTDLNGNELWRKKIKNGNAYMMHGNMALLSSNDRIAMVYESGPGAGYLKTWVSMVDTAGNELWSKSIISQTSSIVQPSIRELPSGNLLVFCSPDTLIYPDQFPLIPYFYELDTSGQVLREGNLNSADKTQIVNRMRISSDGNILIAGKYRDHITDKQSSWIAKIDLTTWQPIWQRFYALPQNIATNFYGGFIDIVETPWGGLACAGKMTHELPGGGVGDTDAWLLSLDSEGCFTPGCGTDYIILDVGEIVHFEPPAQFLVFPNPAEKEVSVRRLANEPSGNVEIFVFDAYGRKVSDSFLAKGALDTKLDVSNLPAGVYFIQVTSGAQTLQFSKLFKIK